MHVSIHTYDWYDAYRYVVHLRKCQTFVQCVNRSMVDSCFCMMVLICIEFIRMVPSKPYGPTCTLAIGSWDAYVSIQRRDECFFPFASRPANLGIRIYSSDASMLLHTIHIDATCLSIDTHSFVYDDTRKWFVFGSTNGLYTYAFHESDTSIIRTEINLHGFMVIIMGMDRDRYVYLLASVAESYEQRLYRIHVDRLYESDAVVTEPPISSWQFDMRTSNGFVCDDGSVAIFSSYVLYSILHDE